MTVAGPARAAKMAGFKTLKELSELSRIPVRTLQHIYKHDRPRFDAIINGAASPKFLPCPFCGDSPHVMPKGNSYTKKRSVTVKCKTCRIERTDAALSHGFDWLYKVAAESWNSRTSAV
jgi:hypothetical protein